MAEARRQIRFDVNKQTGTFLSRLHLALSPTLLSCLPYHAPAYAGLLQTLLYRSSLALDYECKDEAAFSQLDTTSDRFVGQHSAWNGSYVSKFRLLH
jgi:hypothetical protein